MENQDLSQNLTHTSSLTPKKGGLSYKNIVRLSFRSFIRHKIRSLIIIFMIGASLWAYIAMDSMMSGMKSQGKTNVIEYETGDIQLMTDAYWNDLKIPLDKTFRLSNDGKKALKNAGWEISPRINFVAEIILQSPPFDQSGSLYYQVLGIDTQADSRMKNFGRKFVIEGSPTLQDNGVWISDFFAKRINAQLNMPLTLLTKGKGGFFEQLDLVITGIYKSPNIRLNQSFLIVSYDYIDNYLALNGEYNEINLHKTAHSNSKTINLFKTKSSFNKNGTIKKTLQNQVQKIVSQNAVQTINSTQIQLASNVVKAVTWRELGIHRKNITWDVPNFVSGFYMVFLLIIAGIGITNTISIALYAQRKEIGTLQAFGMSHKQVTIMFILEYLFIGIGGVIVGFLLGIPTTLYLIFEGIDYSSFFKNGGFDIPIASDGIIRGAWNSNALIVATLVGIGFSVCVTSYSLFRQRKKYVNVIELLKTQS